jgi:predicted TPR repeat methyltransferase
LGTTLQRQGKIEEAINSFKESISIKPDLIGAYNALGNVLKETGNSHEALQYYEHAISLDANYTTGLFSLGSLLAEQEKTKEATIYLLRCLELDPPDNFGVRLLLAKLNEKEIPSRASEAHMQKLYAERAGVWDTKVSSNSVYKGHEHVADMLRILLKGHKVDILDAGCGTGLVGQLVREYAVRLDGVDISEAMIKKAREKDIYNGLYKDDLVSFMQTHALSYDVITCAATLIHFGDLKIIFEAAFRALKENGLFIATLFPDEANADIFSVAPANGLAQGGCYMHGRDYLRKVANICDFSVEMLETKIHEYIKEDPLQCIVMALKKK